MNDESTGFRGARGRRHRRRGWHRLRRRATIDASGAHVALWDRDAAALDAAKASLGGAAVTHAFDVADAAAVDRAARESLAALGRIDVLVCSAGITGPNKTVWDYPVDDWKRVFDVNVHGLF